MPDESQAGVDEQRDADVNEHQEESRETEDLGDKGKAAIQREREARKAAEKAAADTQKRIDALEAKQREVEEAKAKEQGDFKTLLEQREAELADMKAKLEARDLKDRKAAIAKANGIPEDAISRLQGATDEELEEDAKALAKLLKAREAPDTDAGERTPPGQKKPDKSKFADPAMWGLQ